MNKLRINSVPCRTFAGLPNRWTGTRPNDQSGRLVDVPTANREVTGQTYTPNKLSPLPVSDGFVVDGRRRYFEPFPPRRSPQISIHSTKQGKSVVTKCFRIESLLSLKVSTNNFLKSPNSFGIFNNIGWNWDSFKCLRHRPFHSHSQKIHPRTAPCSSIHFQPPPYTLKFAHSRCSASCNPSNEPFIHSFIQSLFSFFGSFKCQLTNLEQWLLVSKLLFVTSQFALLHMLHFSFFSAKRWCSPIAPSTHPSLRFYCHFDNFSRTADSRFHPASNITIHLIFLQQQQPLNSNTIHCRGVIGYPQ